MKVVSTILLAVIAYFGVTASCVWSIIEFILYLVKDKEFNWWSVSMIFICGFTSLILVIITLTFKSKEKKSFNKKDDSYIPKRSKFQERLEAMRKQNESRR